MISEKIAILYQASPAPLKNGVVKPMKEGGYSDSGADIAYCIKAMGLPIITPVANPREDVDLDWVFPDDRAGIEKAIDAGAQILWLNTVLYKEHPIAKFTGRNLKIVGQSPEMVSQYDNKWVTNELLNKNKIPIPRAQLIDKNESTNTSFDFDYPIVLKPIQGRGSQGVVLVNTVHELEKELGLLFDSNKYGSKLYAEEYLAGKEITLTVMPPGRYRINDSYTDKKGYWCLPPVWRFNHQKGIAPYSGNVAVTENSRVLLPSESKQLNLESTIAHCEKAALLIGARAPVRIDCRADVQGKFFLFDVNLKPNMTGASRTHRHDQDSLTTMAAKEIGWSYGQLIKNIIWQNWTL